jgi:MHS family alpha-ketoglutarate permease-like MFS transporter
MASSGRRGFYSSFQNETLIAGQLVALGVQIILQHILSEPDMKSWGWRIPFVIGAMGALAILWLFDGKPHCVRDKLKSKL